jgi:hypothetical protein
LNQFRRLFLELGKEDIKARVFSKSVKGLEAMAIFLLRGDRERFPVKEYKAELVSRSGIKIRSTQV